MTEGLDVSSWRYNGKESVYFAVVENIPSSTSAANIHGVMSTSSPLHNSTNQECILNCLVHRKILQYYDVVLKLFLLIHMYVKM